MRWLNKNWPLLVSKASTDSAKRPSTRGLAHQAIRKYRSKYPKASIDQKVLAELCRAYDAIWSRYDEGNAPPSAVLLELVAKRHGVSARKIIAMQADASRASS